MKEYNKEKMKGNQKTMLFKVKTTGVYTTAPNQLDFVFTFTTKDEKYDNVVEKGAKTVVEFKEKMKELFDVEKLQTTKYDISTRTKRIEKKIKNETTYEYVFSHYELTQMFILKIPYEKDVLFQIIEKISKIQDGPTYTFNFGLNEEKTQEAENKAMEMAIEYAREKVNSVMKQVGGRNNEYIEAEIVEYFETSRNYYNNVDYALEEMACKCKTSSLKENLSNSITPTDVKIRINVVSKFEIKL